MNWVELRAEIEETKQELVEAKLVRKNRMEYDALAKVTTSYFLHFILIVRKN